MRSPSRPPEIPDLAMAFSARSERRGSWARAGRTTSAVISSARTKDMTFTLASGRPLPQGAQSSFRDVGLFDVGPRPSDVGLRTLGPGLGTAAPQHGSTTTLSGPSAFRPLPSASFRDVGLSDVGPRPSDFGLGTLGPGLGTAAPQHGSTSARTRPSASFRDVGLFDVGPRPSD